MTETYIVYGYTGEDCRDEWEVFGAYADRRDAAEKAINLAADFIDTYRKYREHEGLSDNIRACCCYNDSEQLTEIFDEYNYDFIIRICKKKIYERPQTI